VKVVGFSVSVVFLPPTFVQIFLNMKIIVRVFFLLSVAVCARSEAQTVPIGELRPYLDTLSVAQKVDLLDYMRQLGSSIDREVAQSYLQLDKENQARAIQYIRLKLMQKGDTPESDTRTTVRFAKDTLQLGKVTEGEVILDSFLVTNTGSKPYLIKEVKATCDCTVLRHPTRELMPGERAAIRVEFDSRGKIGHTTPGVVIYDNSRPNGRQIVYLNAEIVPRVKPKNTNGN